MINIYPFHFCSIIFFFLAIFHDEVLWLPTSFLFYPWLTEASLITTILRVLQGNIHGKDENAFQFKTQFLQCKYLQPWQVCYTASYTILTLLSIQ